jgi:biopolymer transport protein ExbD
MKLTSTLKLRPDFLYLAPLLNVVMLMMIFFLVNSSLVVQGGIRVELPVSASTLRPLDGAHVLTLTAGADAAMYLNKERVSLSELPARFQEAKKSSRHIIINADSLVSHGRVTEIQDLVWAAGCLPAVASALAP